MTRVVEVLVTFAERELYSYSQNNDQDQCRIYIGFQINIIYCLALEPVLHFPKQLESFQQ